MTIEGAEGNHIAIFGLEVPRVLPYGNSRVRWYVRHRMVKDIRGLAEPFFSSERHKRKLQKALGHRVVRTRLIRGKGQRFLDDDNALSGVKPYIDSLVKSGWLVDDSRKWVKRSLVDQQRGDKPELIIEVEWEDGS